MKLLWLGAGLSLLVQGCGESSKKGGAPEESVSPGSCTRVGDVCNPDVDPQAGLRCAFGICELSCDYPSGACLQEQFCKPSSTGGYCAEPECMSTFQNDCGAETQCVHTASIGEDPVEAIHHCLELGEGLPGEDCLSHTDCVLGALCLDDVCQVPDCGLNRICTGEDSHCQRFQTEWGDVYEAGVCLDDCSLFAPCDYANWCFPNNFRDPDTILRGSCTETGELLEGEACGVGDALCGVGLRCLDNACQRVCDPEAAPASDADVCEDSQFCRPLTIDVSGSAVALDHGICVERCDLDAGEGCPEGAGECVPEEITGQAPDQCLPIPLIREEFSVCPDEVANALCGGHSACIRVYSSGFDTELRCYQLCRGSAGAYGETGHPDCERADAECRAVFGTSFVYGVCGPT